MKVCELGEFGLIRLLADIVDESKNKKDASWQNLLIGIGDDSAAWHVDNSTQLATTDSLIQDTHFDLNTASWEEIGWKSVAVNLSDIAAMGGIPKYALVSLALPGETETECIACLYQGMAQIANRFGVAIAGGNIASSSKVMITVTVLGNLKNETSLTRSAAMQGDWIAITGYTGLAAAGLKMLKLKQDFDTETNKLLRKAHLEPIPRVREGQALLDCSVRSAIDISDGLIADLTHICEASQVSARINRDLVPIHPALQAHFKDECQQLVLTGGEDYELLFTATGQVMKQVKKTVPCPVTVIGEITEGIPGQVTLSDATGGSYSCEQSGWEHFKSQA